MKRDFEKLAESLTRKFRPGKIFQAKNSRTHSRPRRNRASFNPHSAYSRPQIFYRNVVSSLIAKENRGLPRRWQPIFCRQLDKSSDSPSASLCYLPLIRANGRRKKESRASSSSSFPKSRSSRFFTSDARLVAFVGVENGVPAVKR